jgi:hypothetical protein
VKCGVALAKAKTKGAAGGDVIVASDPPQDPVLMAVLSCPFTGVGQMVLGQTSKGVSILIGSIVLAVITVGLSPFVMVPLIAIDAYRIAKKLKGGKTVTKWEFF